MSDIRGLTLTFTAPDLRDDLSAVLQTGDNLWVASDETTRIERLTRLETGPGQFGDHVGFQLAPLGILPSSDESQEVDIEGMAFCPPYLWLVGSHSLKRLKPDAADPVQAAARLAVIERQANRYLLARIPLARGEDGQWRPERTTAEAHAAALPATAKGNDLTRLLREDPHIAPFLALPGKDNGFDIEGLAVAGNRLFLGLRGPVLRGWAIILELLIGEKDGALRLKKIDDGKKRYRKHFLDLGGLGIRDLCLDGQDMLILAGPTMAGDGPVSVFRWRDALDAAAPSMVARENLPKLHDLPHGPDSDHAEGLSLYEDGSGAAGLVVVYDSPSDARKIGETGVRADLLPLAPQPEQATEPKPETQAKAPRPRRPAKVKA